jgi:hypothetical protein
MFTSYAKPLSAVLFCLASVGTYAHADTITDLGSVYSLSSQTTSVANQYRVNLKIDTTNYTGSNTNTLNAVSLKLLTSNGPSVVASDVHTLSTPAGFKTPLDGGASAGGCDGNGTGFFCVGSPAGVQVRHAGDVYDFDFILVLPNGVTLSSATNADSLKAVYFTPRGKGGGITSRNITLSPEIPISPVPEPSTLLLMATGLIGFGLMFRRQIFTA